MSTPPSPNCLALMLYHNFILKTQELNQSNTAEITSQFMVYHMADDTVTHILTGIISNDGTHSYAEELCPLKKHLILDDRVVVHW